jgi:8-oxo-dGTP diphosphatase
MKVIRRCV